MNIIAFMTAGVLGLIVFAINRNPRDKIEGVLQIVGMIIAFVPLFICAIKAGIWFGYVVACIFDAITL